MRTGPHFQGGPNRDGRAMVEATAAFRDIGGLPPEASLVFSQLVLNMAGHAGRGLALLLIDNFLQAADVPTDDENGQSAHSISADEQSAPPSRAAERAASDIHQALSNKTAQSRGQECTCLGSCKGPEGLGPGWYCALGKSRDKTALSERLESWPLPEPTLTVTELPACVGCHRVGHLVKDCPNRCAKCRQFLSATRIEMRLSVCSNCERPKRARS